MFVLFGAPVALAVSIFASLGAYQSAVGSARAAETSRVASTASREAADRAYPALTTRRLVRLRCCGSDRVAGARARRSLVAAATGDRAGGTIPGQVISCLARAYQGLQPEQTLWLGTQQYGDRDGRLQPARNPVLTGPGPNGSWSFRADFFVGPDSAVRADTHFAVVLMAADGPTATAFHEYDVRRAVGSHPGMAIPAGARILDFVEAIRRAGH